jgi:hypothetical protein
MEQKQKERERDHGRSLNGIKKYIKTRNGKREREIGTE